MWMKINGGLDPATLAVTPMGNSSAWVSGGLDWLEYTCFRWDWQQLYSGWNIHDSVAAIGKLADVERQDAAFAQAPFAGGGLRQWQGMVQVDCCLVGRTKDPKSYLRIRIVRSRSRCIVCGRQGCQQAGRSRVSAESYYIFIRKAWDSSWAYASGSSSRPATKN